MHFQFIAGATLMAVACAPPSPQPQPNEMERVVNVTRIENAAPPGALGNEQANYAEGPITPAEREDIRDVEQQTPAQVVALQANLIVQRRFDEAYRMWAPEAADFTPEQFEQTFARLETIQAAVGNVAPAQGAGGAAQRVQLTLTGRTEAGRNYSLTGPVTVAPADGATGEQARWRIVKMVLTGSPRAAEALVQQ